MKQGALQTAFALGLGRVLAQMLYQVSPSDPVALIAASVMLGSAALLACFLPGPPRDARDVNDGPAHRIEAGLPLRTDARAKTLGAAGLSHSAARRMFAR